MTEPGVLAETYGTGAGGEIHIDPDELEIRNGGFVSGLATLLLPPGLVSVS